MITRTDEAMICLAEEAGELTQAAMKIVRFGNSETARMRLEEEAGDVLCLIDWLVQEGVFTKGQLEINKHNKRIKLTKYSNLYNERGDANVSK
jgi:NTP pyrophosphatase (non-canonical NTP hydrolase)